MPGGKKGLMEGSSPPKCIRKVVLSPKEYNQVLIATIKNVAKAMG